MYLCILPQSSSFCTVSPLYPNANVYTTIKRRVQYLIKSNGNDNHNNKQAGNVVTNQQQHPCDYRLEQLGVGGVGTPVSMQRM